MYMCKVVPHGDSEILIKNPEGEVVCYVDCAGEIYIPSDAEDGVENNRESAEVPVSRSTGDEGTSRPPRGRESDGKGIVEWDVYENEDGTTTYVYSFEGPVQAELKLVLPFAKEAARAIRGELRRLLEDMRSQLVFLRPPVPVLPRSFSGRHERDVRGGFSEDLQPDNEYFWARARVWRGVSRNWENTSELGATHAENEGAN